MKHVDMRVTLEIDESTQRLLAGYIHLREGKSFDSREIVPNAVYADYDDCDELLGIELLEPCDPAVLNKLVDDEPSEVKNLVRNEIPLQLSRAVASLPGIQTPTTIPTGTAAP